MLSIERTQDLDAVRAQNHLFFPTADLSDNGYKWSTWWLARDGDRVVGYAGLYASPEATSEAWLIRCGVHRSHRRMGLARRLTRVRIAHWKKYYPDRDLYTYTLATNFGSNSNMCRNAGLVPYKIADDFIYWYRARPSARP